MSTTLTIYTPTSDGGLKSKDSSYSVARETVFEAGDILLVGQQHREVGTYHCYEALMLFDTSSIGGGSVSSAILHVYGEADASDINFTSQARLGDTWSGTTTFDTTDWVAGSDLSSKTLLATFASSGFNASGYNTFTSEAAFINNINTTGKTYIMISAQEQAENTNNVPDGSDIAQLTYKASTGGESTDAKLVVIFSPLITGDVNFGAHF